MNVGTQSMLCCFLLLTLSLSSAPSHAQSPPDSIYSEQAAMVVNSYTRERLGPDSRLYNGREYIRNGTPAKGFPFFNSDTLVTGRVAYDGILYHNIFIEYDLVADEVIIPDYSGKTLIGLVSERVDSFNIGTHVFRFFTNASLPRTGFYDVLFVSGPIVLLGRHEKTLILPSTLEEQARYDEHDAYYLRTNNGFVNIDDESSLLHALQDKKDQLKRYIRDNKLRFKHQEIESTLSQVTAHYTQIKP